MPNTRWMASSLLTLALASAAPAARAAEFTVAAPDEAAFHGRFEGFGAEWDPFFWNTNNQNRGCTQADWDLITTRIQDLQVAWSG